MRSAHDLLTSYGWRPTSGASSLYGRTSSDPYALSDDATTICFTFGLRLHASSRRQVPAIFVSNVEIGLRLAIPTMVSVPRGERRCRSRIRRESVFRTASWSRTSPRTNFARSSSPDRMSCESGTQSRTRQTTSASAPIRRRTSQPPRRPVAPVTERRRSRQNAACPLAPVYAHLPAGECLRQSGGGCAFDAADAQDRPERILAEPMASTLRREDIHEVRDLSTAAFFAERHVQIRFRPRSPSYFGISYSAIIADRNVCHASSATTR